MVKFTLRKLHQKLIHKFKFIPLIEHSFLQLYSMALYNNTHSVLPHSSARYDLPCVVVYAVYSVGEISVLCCFVWNLLGGPHESGYIYLLRQSSPLAQCSTATTCTTQTRLCTIASHSGHRTCGGPFDT